MTFTHSSGYGRQTKMKYKTLLIAAIVLFCPLPRLQPQILQVIVAASSGGAAGSCAALNGFTHCRKLTIDHTQVPSTQTNFTVLVSQTILNLKSTGNGGSVTDAQGDDIVFTSDSGCTTMINWDPLESWNSSTGAIVAWVKIASVSSSSDTLFYICYGKGSITTFQGGSAGSAWDSNFTNVYHMSDNAANTTVVDATGNSNGTNAANTSTKSIAGQISNGLNYSLTSDQTVVTTAAFTSIRTWSVSCWVNPLSLSMSGLIYVNDAAGTQAGLDIDGSMHVHAFSGGTTPPVGSSTLSAGTWYYASVISDQSIPSITVYLNGVSDGTANTTGLLATTASSTFGNLATSFNVGKLDECRLSSVARSADWTLTEFRSMNTPATFITVGAES
jgi:hypothetical protein